MSASPTGRYIDTGKGLLTGPFSLPGQTVGVAARPCRAEGRGVPTRAFQPEPDSSRSMPGDRPHRHAGRASRGDNHASPVHSAAPPGAIAADAAGIVQPHVDGPHRVARRWGARAGCGSTPTRISQGRSAYRKDLAHAVAECRRGAGLFHRSPRSATGGMLGWSGYPGEAGTLLRAPPVRHAARAPLPRRPGRTWFGRPSAGARAPLSTVRHRAHCPCPSASTHANPRPMQPDEFSGGVRCEQ